LFTDHEVTIKLNHGYYYQSSTGLYLKETIAEPKWMCIETLLMVQPGMQLTTNSNVSLLVNKFDNNMQNIPVPVSESALFTINQADAKYIGITLGNNNEMDELVIKWLNYNEERDNTINNLLQKLNYTLKKSTQIECTMNPYLLLNKTNGALIDFNNKNYLVSDPINVSNTEYIAFSCVTWYNNAVVAFYDDNNNCLSTILNEAGEVDSTSNGKHIFNDYIAKIPPLAVTMRFAPHTDAPYSIYVGEYAHAEIMDARTDSNGKYYNSLKDSIAGQIAELGGEKILIDVTPQYVPKKIIKNVDGSIIDYNHNSWGISEPVECSEGQTYYIHSYMDYGNAILCCYDSDDNLIDYIKYLDNRIVDNTILYGNNLREYNYSYTIPQNGSYFILGLYYGTTENVDTTGYSVKTYGDKIYFEPKESSVRNIVNDVLASQSSGNTEIIDIASSDKIGFFGNSYMNGYTIRTHHVFDNLSMWSDYLFYNYGKSGDDVLETLARINRNEKFLGDVPVNDWGLTYGILGMYTNDGALFAANNETFYQNCKKVCEAILAMGAVPILSTEHNKNQMLYAMQALADRENYEFWNWANTASAMKWFKPFMLNGHPATRTHWSWTYGLKNYIDCLPRPMKSIKIFKKRPDIDGTDLDNLKYNDVYERSERFVEIYNGSSCLTKATEKLFDRLNNGESHEAVKSQYQTLQNGQQISLDNYALIECITPFTKNTINQLQMIINISGVTNAYIRRITQLENPLSELRYIAFGIVDGESLLIPGNKITITGGVFNDNILGEYTISGIVNGMLVTTTNSSGKTTSGTDNPTTNISGVTLKGSYDYPSVDYMNNYDLPLCEWESIEFESNGSTDLMDYVANCMDYDKISLLFVGNDIALKNIKFIAGGGSKKITQNKRKPKEYKYGESLLTDNLLDDGTSWIDINSIEKYTPVISAVDNTTVDPYPTGVTTVRVIHEGESLKQNIITQNLGKNAYYPDKIQIRILARYFPKYIDSDTAWESSEIYEGSFDCAKMSISLDGSVKVGKALVGASWWEYIFDIDYNNIASTKQLSIYCDNKSIQIAKAEVVLVQ